MNRLYHNGMIVPIVLLSLVAADAAVLFIFGG